MHLHAELSGHNKDERHSSLEKIYLSLYLKGFKRVTKGFTVWEESWRLNRTATYWPPLLWPYQRFPFVLLGCSTGGLAVKLLWVLVFSTILSATHLIPNSSDFQLIWPPTADFLSSPGLYNDLTPTPLPASVIIARVQPVHGQGYHILILFTNPSARAGYDTRSIL